MGHVLLHRRKGELCFCGFLYTNTHTRTHARQRCSIAHLCYSAERKPPSATDGGLVTAEKVLFVTTQKGSPFSATDHYQHACVCVCICVYVCSCVCVAVCSRELHLIRDKEGEKTTHTRNIIHHNAVTHNVEQHPHLPAIHTRQLLHRSIHTLEETVVLQCVAVGCSGLQYVTVRPQYTHASFSTDRSTLLRRLQCCIVLQCVAVGCSMLQCAHNTHTPASPQCDLHSYTS